MHRPPCPLPARVNVAPGLTLHSDLCGQMCGSQKVKQKGTDRIPITHTVSRSENHFQLKSLTVTGCIEPQLLHAAVQLIDHHEPVTSQKAFTAAHVTWTTLRTQAQLHHPHHLLPIQMFGLHLYCLYTCITAAESVPLFAIQSKVVQIDFLKCVTTSQTHHKTRDHETSALQPGFRVSRRRNTVLHRKLNTKNDGTVFEHVPPMKGSHRLP